MSTPDQPPVPPPAPAKKSNTLVIVLLVILGIFLLLLASCVGTCFYVGKKAQAYAKESEKSPKISALALAAAIYPGVEVVSKDLDAGSIVLRNKKTGETLQLNASDFSEDKIAEIIQQVSQGKGMEAVSTPVTGPSAESTTTEAGHSVQGRDEQKSAFAKFSADFPIYTSGSVETLEARHETIAGMASSQHVFLTNDSPSKVAEFYADKLKAAGYTLRASDTEPNDNGLTATSLFQKDGVNSTFDIHAQIEAGKTRVEVNHVLLKR